MSPLLSIIIPIYNTDIYLPMCLDSILAQNFTDFELILIDDGSTDKSGIICDEYAKIDNRITVFHQKNCGISTARNKGIQIATGKYIIFIDSDDTMPENNLQKIMTHVLENNKDITLCTYIIDFNNDYVITETITATDDILMGKSFIDVLKIFISEPIVPWSACRNVYKRDFLLDNNIYFNPNFTSGEDCDFYFTACKFAQTFGAINIPIIRYRAGRSYSTINTFSAINILSISVVYDKWQQFFISNFDKKSIMPILSFFSIHYYNFIFQVAKLDTNNDFLPICENYKQILKYTTGLKKQILVKAYYILGIKNSIFLLSKFINKY